MRMHVLILPLLFMMVASASAYSTAGVNSLLMGYGVPNSIISSLQFVNLTYNAHGYAALYSSTTGRLLFVANLTGNYSIVTNATSIFNIIRNYTIGKAFSAANFSELKRLLLNYTNSSNAPLHDCLVETGLTTGVSCTVANNCLSCQSVPSCNKIFYETDGVSGSFGQGIVSFNSTYPAYVSNMSAFNSTIASMNASNAQYRLHAVDSAVADMLSISKSLLTNPIFPLPPNVTNSELGYCRYYANYSSATTPWYCQSIGYCGHLGFNSSAKSRIMAYMFYIGSQPLQDQQVMGIADNATAITDVYVLPVLAKQKGAALSAIMNTTLANYSALSSGASALLSHVSNATLSASLAAMEKAYANFTANYMLMNLTAENRTLALMVANLSRIYSPLSSAYSYLLSVARNNTQLLLEAQLNSRISSSQLSSASFQEMGINSQFSGKISNVSYVEAGLSGISKEAKGLYAASLPLLSLTGLARSIDGTFATSLASAMHLQYGSALSLVPAFSALLSLIIGLILFAVAAFFYSNMKLHHRLKLNRRTRRNWRNLFAIIWIAIALYVIATYFVAASANAFTPISAFQNAVKASPYLVVAINGTPSINTYECASQISKTAISMGKKPVLISFSNSVCTVGNETLTEQGCLNSYAQIGVPMVILGGSGSDYIHAYSFYGAYLLANGGSPFMTACYPALLLN